MSECYCRATKIFYYRALSPHHLMMVTAPNLPYWHHNSLSRIGLYSGRGGAKSRFLRINRGGWTEMVHYMTISMSPD